MSILAKGAYWIANTHIDRQFRKNGLERKLEETDDYIIEYWDNGKSHLQPFIFIHGFGAKTKYQWYKQLSAVSDKYHLIVPNLLFFGETKAKHHWYSVQNQVDFMRFFLDYKNVKDPLVMGASYGALVAAEVERIVPGTWRRIFLVDAALKYVYEEDSLRVMKRFDIPSIPDLFAPSDTASMQKHIKAAVGQYVPKFLLNEFHNEFFGEDRQHKLRLANEMIRIRPDYEHHEYSIEAPVHLIWGENDYLIPPERGVLLQKHIGANATLDIIKKAGHMPNMKRGNRFNRIMLSYLKD